MPSSVKASQQSENPAECLRWFSMSRSSLFVGFGSSATCRDITFRRQQAGHGGPRRESYRYSVMGQKWGSRQQYGGCLLRAHHLPEL